MGMRPLVALRLRGIQAILPASGIAGLSGTITPCKPVLDASVALSCPFWEVTILWTTGTWKGGFYRTCVRLTVVVPPVTCACSAAAWLLRHATPLLYEVVADVNRYKEFVPWCTDSVVHGPAVDLWVPRPFSFKATLDVGFKVIGERYTSVVNVVPLQRVVVSRLLLVSSTARGSLTRCL